MDIRVLQFKTEFPPGKDPQDWVLFTSKDALGPSGEVSHATWEKTSRLIPTESPTNDDTGFKMAAMRSQWAQIEPAYLAWKDGQELPETGIPLAAWPGVNVQQAEALKGVGLKTVEAIADAPESLLSRPPIPNMREIKKQARAWLDGRDAVAQADTIAKLQEQNAAMLEMLEELQQAETKRGPGRPRKEAAEADAA
jgi:hypothetical protein